MIFETDTESMASADSEPLLGTLDLVIVFLVFGGALYWYFSRKKETTSVAVKQFAVVPSLGGQSTDTSFVTKMKNSGRNVVVFYGSQTGTAEEFAGRLSKDAQRYGLKGMVADPEECEMEDLSRLAEIENAMAIFCMATYGEGDPTDNSQEFYDWLQAGDAELNGLNFAVFGLGNKTYEHFNSMGIYVDKRMEELGGQRVYDVGLGDDDGNIEDDFITWREQFWPAVCAHFGIQATGDDISMRQYSLTVHEDVKPERVFSGESARLGSFRNQRPPYDAKNPYMSPVSANKELHNGGDRSCMHIELDISGSRIKYEAGDHVAVYPINDPEIVEGIGRQLGADLGTVFTLTNVDEEASKKNPFPCPTTYRTALSHYLDVTSTPRTHILSELADYATDPKDLEFLKKMTQPTPEGKALYNDWIHKDHRNILAVLEDLPSLKPPLDHLCELLPRLQARYYSISSSPHLHPNHIHITAVLVDYKTRVGRHVKGVATSWLKLKQPTNGLKPTVPIYVRKSQFRLPFKPIVPIIMVGPGTGLAPFRGFIQDRHHAKKEGKKIGDTILYFGCRHKEEDFLYREELESYLGDGSLSLMHTAFSRDQPKKIYVQDLMNNNKQEIWGVLDKGGHIYVCGDARNMARDVHSCLEAVIMECGGKSKDEAIDYIKKLQSRGRYSQDVWS